MSTRESTLIADVELAVDVGHIAVLFCVCGVGMNTARGTARQISSWLHRDENSTTRRLSRSATNGLAAVAVHLNGIVGIDVETDEDSLSKDDLLEEILHPDERRNAGALNTPTGFLSMWVRKEAVLKAFGVGLAVSPRTTCTGAFDPEWRRVDHRQLGHAKVRSLPAPSGFAAALAFRGHGIPEVELFDVSRPFLPRPSG